MSQADTIEQQPATEAGDGPGPAAAVHRRRHPRHRCVRAHRRRRRRSRWRGVASVPGGLPDRHRHRVQLPRTGHQVPAGRGRSAVRAQGFRHPVRHVPGRVRRDVLRNHLGLDGVAILRVELLQGLRTSTGARPESSSSRCSSWRCSRRSICAASGRASSSTWS